MKHIELFKKARMAGAPIIVMRSPDHNSTIASIKAAMKPDAKLLCWDISRGIEPISEAASEASVAVNGELEPAMSTSNPVEALQKALALMPEGCVLFMLNPHLLMEQQGDARIPVIQCISNMRDPFKSSRRTLVMLVPDMKLPPELSNDVAIIDVPLPGRAEVEQIVADTHKAANVPLRDAGGAVDAALGLSSFAAEQAVAMSMTKDGINLPALWERKKSIIEQVGGLKVHRARSSFDALGGLGNIKDFARLILAGKRPPKLVVLVDEIEKQMAGLNDSNGINQDAFGQLLAAMQDNNWSGMLLPGFPGTGKTEFGNAMGSEAGGLFITLDLGGTKSSLVGSSEKMIRAAIATLLAMGGEDVFFIGTCNSMGSLRPELKRRFGHGTFFFDLPTQDEQRPIWDIYRKRYEIPEASELPKCALWTGAEIKRVCQLSYELGISLKDASKYITPVARVMGDEVEALRSSANNKYLSATLPGLYQNTPTKTASKERKIEVGNN